MGKDVELVAITQVAQALDGLDERTVARVIRWALDRFGISTGGSDSRNLHGSKERGATRDFLTNDASTDLPTFYDAANPTIASEKALVVAYWFQEVEKNEHFESQAINTKLKNLGHGVENITRAFDALQNTSPRFVIQIEKSGQHRQARKKYKVTTEGIRKVRAMIQERMEQQKQ